MLLKLSQRQISISEIYVYIYIYIYIYIYVCMCVCVCIYITHQLNTHQLNTHQQTHTATLSCAAKNFVTYQIPNTNWGNIPNRTEQTNRYTLRKGKRGGGRELYHETVTSIKIDTKSDKTLDNHPTRGSSSFIRCPIRMALCYKSSLMKATSWKHTYVRTK